MCDTMKLFDSHCHLQDPRILNMAPQLIETALNSGIRHFAVNGVSENDCIWYVAERTPFWFNTLKDFFHATPAATVGEIGLDKGSRGREINFVNQFYLFNFLFQVEVFQQQLELAKELKRPVSVHCVRAFGDLLQIMQYGHTERQEVFRCKTSKMAIKQKSSLMNSTIATVAIISTSITRPLLPSPPSPLLLPLTMYILLLPPGPPFNLCYMEFSTYFLRHVGPFPAGVILHSYLGSAEMVPEFAKLGAYFSFSGYLMSMKEQKAKKMLRTIPVERILLESDAPDALPKSDLDSLFWVERDSYASKELQTKDINPASSSGNLSDNPAARNKSVLPQETLNHPANIHSVLLYVASLLEMSKEELAEISYRNAVRLFSFEGSKISLEA
ncbi:hypothetical protein CK203_043356 [Vitis vinifera]|uniref:Uncharacterized protein n=1 Tax=Vitis vinifera TaxID=29760 RepID=A0A438GYC4_VITVI|nr:hypothetical protein CK203_043356 [Vitis vinifera]